VLTQVEYIQLDLTQMTKLLYGKNLATEGENIRAALSKMIEAKQASIMDTLVLRSRSGEAARTESSHQFFYATEYEPAEISPAKLDPKTGKLTEGDSVGPTPTAFEERPIGSVFEKEATVNLENKTIYLSLSPEIAYHTGFETWSEFKNKHGEANIVMPKFYRLKLQTGITLKDGKYMLLGSHSAKDKDGKMDANKKILVFARCIILPNKK